ncbi:tripartite tricarboxylate transporter substrate binding protein [Variovorax sp. J31P179]|jgi:tripartite-type tricarboxylate transporter receptor subunit TctC|uniref:Bug family tripartite tricarboxylate transporter substrate binding protein n=1 Tax=Variovorax sp. J31P179 TaxID=3053508 RepID=UPI002577DEA5|nr:tripartite tricarboxylate transporter substrate binding protein [Variovorax sp. J31P179]MDM0079177.1 tripartite tricarboxylate transporter substrate binding protein [Variovorax sp. J31P179]
MQRRTILRWAAPIAAALALPHGASWGAEAYPEKPVRLIVGFASGGGADAITRIMAEGLSRQLGQQVVVENRPGADGVLAAQAVSGARPDGYTLLMGTNTAMVAAPTLRPNPPYDPFKAFAPISSAGQFSMFLVVPASLPVKSVGDLLAMVAARPGAYNSASSNSASELAMLQLLGGRKVVNARYKGDMQAMTDLLGGQVQMMFTTGTLAPAFVRDGRIRALVTLQPQRSALLPDVPSAGELGLGKLTITPWAGFFGPPGLPAGITEKLSAALQQTLKDPAVHERLTQQGFEGYGMSPAKFAEFFRAQHDAFVSTVREHGVSFE